MKDLDEDRVDRLKFEQFFSFIAGLSIACEKLYVCKEQVKKWSALGRKYWLFFFHLAKLTNKVLVFFDKLSFVCLCVFFLCFNRLNRAYRFFLGPCLGESILQRLCSTKKNPENTEASDDVHIWCTLSHTSLLTDSSAASAALGFFTCQMFSVKMFYYSCQKETLRRSFYIGATFVTVLIC